MPAASSSRALSALAATIILCGESHAVPPESPEQETGITGSEDFPFSVHPALSFLAPDRAELTWNSSTTGRSLVTFGPVNNPGRKVVSKTEGSRHRVVLDQLLPNTPYHYKITTRTRNGTANIGLMTLAGRPGHQLILYKNGFIDSHIIELITHGEYIIVENDIPGIDLIIEVIHDVLTHRSQ